MIKRRTAFLIPCNSTLLQYLTGVQMTVCHCLIANLHFNNMYKRWLNRWRGDKLGISDNVKYRQNYIYSGLDIFKSNLVVRGAWSFLAEASPSNLPVRLSVQRPIDSYRSFQSNLHVCLSIPNPSDPCRNFAEQSACSSVCQSIIQTSLNRNFSEQSVSSKILTEASQDNLFLQKFFQKPLRTIWFLKKSLQKPLRAICM